MHKNKNMAWLKLVLVALHVSLMTNGAIAQPMTFELQGNGGNCNGCGWIAAHGEITADTPEAFRAFLSDFQNELLAPVMFDSPGGNLGAALELGRLLRESNATTTVGRSEPSFGPWFEWVDGGQCSSACVFAFLGGATRWAATGELGVHQFYLPNDRNIPTDITQQIMGELVIYLIEMGISSELLSFASHAAPDDMIFLNDLQMQQLQITTTSVETPINLEARDGGLVAVWQTLSDNGTVDRYYQLRCSTSQQAWLLTVRDTGIGENNYIISDAMHITIADMRTPLGQSSILDLEAVGDELQDTRITVRLPIDLRQTPGEVLVFETNETRNFRSVLGAYGSLPDAETLDVMVRACGA